MRLIHCLFFGGGMVETKAGFCFVFVFFGATEMRSDCNCMSNPFTSSG